MSHQPGTTECPVQSSFLLLVYPILLSRCPARDLALVEPQGNLFLGALDTIGSVADVAADVLELISNFSLFSTTRETHDGIVATNCAWSGCQWVGGTEQLTTDLAGFLALPDHSADWSRVHVCNDGQHA